MPAPRLQITTVNTQRNHRPISLFMILTLIAATTAAYSNSFRGVFLFDDEGEIVNSERIKTIDLSGLLRGESSRPLVDLSLRINYALADAAGKLEDHYTFERATESGERRPRRGGLNPWGYHLFNLTVHILAGLTLFGLVRRLAETRIESSRARNLAFAVALLWLVHPLNTQAVTYIIQRAESMMGLFYLLTMYCYVRSMASHLDVLWIIATVSACACGMMCKEVMVTAPLAVALCDFVFYSGRPSTHWRSRLILCLLLAATWLIPVYLGAVGSALGSGNESTTVGLGYSAIRPIEYLRTQAGVILHYIRLAIWPWPLVLDYEWPVAKSFNDYGPQGLVVLLALAASIWATIRRRASGFAGLMFFLALAPTSSIMPIKDVIFEHRMYLSLAAIISILVCGVSWVLTRSNLQKVAPVILAIVALPLCILTWARNNDYQSARAMWLDVLSKQPASPRAHANLGHFLALEGRNDEAIAEFRTAIRSSAQPKFSAAHYNLANLLRQRGELEEAIVYYQQARKLAPHEIETAINLADVLSTQKKYEEAEQVLRVGLEKADKHTTNQLRAVAWFNLGNTLAAMGKIDGADEAYRKSIEIMPTYAKAHYGLGWSLQMRQRVAEAAAEYRLSLSLAEDAQVRSALEALLSNRPELTKP